ncbi:origin recognition complex subunit 6 [Asbolus verrucosus]|uniref:Origin recognition complex subunit 6 n=1 Tax=Asbolus verrucosus TaxID=1661398 RepID=A0A482WD49_ASBVE|nr:origin recognition complex subunit 6 [Asbolus verrucosus]
MTSNKILLNSSDRLGIQDSSAIKKADAFLRVLNSKSVSKTISDAARTILCLDLAAASLGVGFDKTTALKLAGLRKGVYQNNLNILEKVLNLDKPITVAELCVQCSCTEAKETAEAILASYREYDKKIKDISHPQYVAAAVYTSCKISGIKVEKSQFKSISRLKMAQWNELADEFAKFAGSMGLSAKKGRSKRNAPVEQDGLIEIIEKHSVQKQKKEEEQIEDYEVWRERILKEATAEILKNEMSG